MLALYHNNVSKNIISFIYWHLDLTVCFNAVFISEWSTCNVVDSELIKMCKEATYAMPFSSGKISKDVRRQTLYS